MGDFFGKPTKSKKNLSKFADFSQDTSRKRDTGQKCFCGHPVTSGGVCARCGALNMDDNVSVEERPYSEKMGWALQNGFFGDVE